MFFTHISILKTVFNIDIVLLIIFLPMITESPIAAREAEVVDMKTYHNKYRSIVRSALLWALTGLMGTAGLPPGVRAAAQLTVYSGRGEQFTKPVTNAFTAKTGIPVQVQTGFSAALLAKLQVEKDKSPADIFMTNYVGVLEEARAHELLAPVTSPLVEQIPAPFRAEDNTWMALSARLRVIVYNTNMIRPDAVTSLFDLADPKWKGKVGTVTSGNESFIGGVTAIYALYGPEKTEGFCAGSKPIHKGKSCRSTRPLCQQWRRDSSPSGW
jgi:iron(III) transport system substrate-binding protein